MKMLSAWMTEKFRQLCTRCQEARKQKDEKNPERVERRKQRQEKRASEMCRFRLFRFSFYGMFLSFIVLILAAVIFQSMGKESSPARIVVGMTTFVFLMLCVVVNTYSCIGDGSICSTDDGLENVAEKDGQND